MIVMRVLLGWNFSAVFNKGHGRISFLIFVKLSSSCNKLHSLPAPREWFTPHPNPSSQGESVNPAHSQSQKPSCSGCTAPSSARGNLGLDLQP